MANDSYELEGERGFESPKDAAHADRFVVELSRDRYLGEEKIDVVGQLRRAFKFSIKVPLFPEFIAWTSPRGLLLAVAVQHEGKDWPEETMKLVHFQEWAGFE